jgi:hypothetical protein
MQQYNGLGSEFTNSIDGEAEYYFMYLGHKHPHSADDRVIKKLNKQQDGIDPFDFRVPVETKMWSDSVTDKVMDRTNDLREWFSLAENGQMDRDAYDASDDSVNNFVRVFGPPKNVKFTWKFDNPSSWQPMSKWGNFRMSSTSPPPTLAKDQALAPMALVSFFTEDGFEVFYRVYMVRRVTAPHVNEYVPRLTDFDKAKLWVSDYIERGFDYTALYDDFDFKAGKYALHPLNADERLRLQTIG